MPIQTTKNNRIAFVWNLSSFKNEVHSVRPLIVPKKNHVIDTIKNSLWERVKINSLTNATNLTKYKDWYPLNAGVLLLRVCDKSATVLYTSRNK